jgi:plasmid maintenance system killer protein
MVGAAVRLDDLRSPPGNQLEALKGDRRQQSMINRQCGFASVDRGRT